MLAVVGERVIIYTANVAYEIALKRSCTTRRGHGVSRANSPSRPASPLINTRPLTSRVAPVGEPVQEVV